MTKDYIDKFRIDDLTIKEYKNWIISVRPQQPALGSLVLSLKRTCEHVGGMTAKETEELAVVFKQTEALLKESFGYDKINYLCLMMVDEQVHFHVIPRYEKPKTLNGVTIPDKGWPGPPELSQTTDNEKLIQKIKITLTGKGY